MTAFKNVKGMNDLLPAQAGQWAQIETRIKSVLSSYQYQETRSPLVEKTALFRRSIGEVTDVVEKEMYSVEDRDGEQLTLRPEMTAGLVRSAIQNGMLHNQTQRLWSIGPVFRYEKPQKGRARQFHQVDVEAFGFEGPDIDAEIICLSAAILQRLGVKDIKLHVNSLGSPESRQAYRAALIEYFSEHAEILDEDSKNRLHKNPLRILDSKNPAMAEILMAAPQMINFLSEQCHEHFETLLSYLDAVGMEYEVNPRLVRGLDYYNRTVFEWMASDGLGAQNTVCGGGRYDGLVEQLGGKTVPGIGFGMGLERLMLLLEAQQLLPELEKPDYYVVVSVSDENRSKAFAIVEKLRQHLQDVKIELNCGGASIKSQMKKADKSGASTTLILADSEIAENTITVKPMHGGEQKVVDVDTWMHSAA
jgi:histidyl-tRNA synthetase